MQVMLVTELRGASLAWETGTPMASGIHVFFDSFLRKEYFGASLAWQAWGPVASS